MKNSIILIGTLASLIYIGHLSGRDKTYDKKSKDPINAKNPGVRTIEPVIGETPDISTNAANKLERLKYLYLKVDSVVSSYPDYQIAKKHLSKRQIQIYENEEEYSKEDHLDVSIWGCSWYCAGGPSAISSSSMLAPSNYLNYKPKNAHDFSLRTAWIEGSQGTGIGEYISYKFAKMSPPVTTVEIFNGYMKSEKTWKENSRVKQLTMFVNNKPYAQLNLKDITSRQIFTVGKLQGITNDMVLKFQIATIYKGSKYYNDVAISEIEFSGTGVH
ncbi:MAG: hypothetical protein EOO85_13680 [Pedobacter sp.]|nr:MAG: hypothetical protein EOO85_13680 [Pedobacter sp.]